MFVSSDHMQAW